MGRDDRSAVRAAAAKLLAILDEVGDDVASATVDIATVMEELLAEHWLDDVPATPVAGDQADPVGIGWLYHDADLRIVRGRMVAGFAQEPHDHGSWNIFAVYRGAAHYRSYRRLDDGSRPYRAQLEVAEDRVLTDGDVTVLPAPPHDIHAVTALAPSTTTLLVARGPFNPVRRQYLPDLGAYRELSAYEAAPVTFDLAEVDRLLSTTRALRRRLDLVRPVDPETVLQCIALARYAPNASNAQEWHWVVVTAADTRKRVGEQYRKVLEPLVSTMLANKLAERDEAGVRISRSVLYLAEHMGEVPVQVFPCFDIAAARERYGRLLSPERAPSAMRPDQYASIYPAVWSFQLALRSRGLGSVLTTAHLEDQPAMARILDVPETWVQACLVPVAHVRGGALEPAPRRSVEHSVTWR